MAFIYSISLITLQGQLAFSYFHYYYDLMPEKANLLRTPDLANPNNFALPLSPSEGYPEG